MQQWLQSPRRHGVSVRAYPENARSGGGRSRRAGPGIRCAAPRVGRGGVARCGRITPWASATGRRGSARPLPRGPAAAEDVDSDNGTLTIVHDISRRRRTAWGSNRARLTRRTRACTASPWRSPSSTTTGFSGLRVRRRAGVLRVREVNVAAPEASAVGTSRARSYAAGTPATGIVLSRIRRRRQAWNLPRGWQDSNLKGTETPPVGVNALMVTFLACDTLEVKPCARLPLFS